MSEEEVGHTPLNQDLDLKTEENVRGDQEAEPSRWKWVELGSTAAADPSHSFAVPVRAHPSE